MTTFCNVQQYIAEACNYGDHGQGSRGEYVECFLPEGKVCPSESGICPCCGQSMKKKNNTST